MYDPAGQHPKRAALSPVDAHPPPHNVPLNPLLSNTIQTQRRVIPTNMINKRETITYIKIMKNKKKKLKMSNNNNNNNNNV